MNIASWINQLKRWWPAVAILVTAIVLIAGPELWQDLVAPLAAGERIKAAIMAAGPLAPLAYIAFYAIQILVAPIPGSPFALASGYLFGPIAGGIYSLVAAALGLTLAMALSRRFGRPLVARLVGQEEIDRWEEALGTESALLWYFVFLLPIGDAGYYLAGLSRARLRRLVIAGVLARAPNQFVMSWVGAQTGERLILALIGLILLSAVILLAWQRWGRQLQARVLALGRRSASIAPPLPPGETPD